MISMQVTKRDGTLEDVSFDKVLLRIRKASDELEVDPVLISQRVVSRIYQGVRTSELDELAANLAISLATTNPDYATLAARISISNHQKNTPATLQGAVQALTAFQKHNLSHSYVAFVERWGAELEKSIDYERDFLLDYFGFKTLELQHYLMRDPTGRVVERPQHLWMRVASALWLDKLPQDATPDHPVLTQIRSTYDLLSTKTYIHATPTNFNAGTQRQQMSSCFLLAMKEDSISGIYDTLKDCAQISKHAGGIGLHIHNVRAKGSHIAGTNGTSNGIVPMLRNFNMTARYVDQCFHPETLVYTQRGPQQIQHISVSDKVLTQDGKFTNVIIPVRHEYKGKILQLEIKNAIFPIQVTPEHPIMALQGQKKGLNHSVIKNRLSKNLATIEFIEAKELNIDDFVVFPIPKYEQDIVHISENDCRMYGILVGDGYISKDVAGVSLHIENKKNTRKFVEDYMANHGIKTYVTEIIEQNCVQIKWSSTSTGFKFIRNQLYNEESDKIIDSCFIHLPKHKILKVLQGILETDGCIGETEISLEMSSYPVIEAVRYMLLRIGALSSGYERDRVGNISAYKNIETKKKTLVLRIPRVPEILEMFPHAPTSENFTFLRYGDFLMSRIISKTDMDYEGVLHDFEIAGPHDYTIAHLGLAHNGGGKRNGSFAIYLEPWHADVEDFLKLRVPQGAEEERARDLFYALWVPDLFMERVEQDTEWTLFCPHEAPGLADCWGDDFRRLYERYEAEGRGRRKVSAQKLWFKILDSQIETGTPYILYKDAANAKSNQANLGTIKSSNLCCEIIEYSSPEETAVCNLASISLPAFVQAKTKTFDYARLRQVVHTAVMNLNRVIDINYYPTEECLRSNMRHRPIGLGIQGLADVFALLRAPWESEKAADINQRIAEHIYYAAVEASAELAAAEGPYTSYQGSPASLGKLQPDLWGVVPLTQTDASLDWSSLRAKVAANGLRNSLLVAPMPTASTSQILGNTECFEPVLTNIFTRRTLSGEYIVINKHLMRELRRYDVWSEQLKQKIIAQNGSVQGLAEVPEPIQKLFKTAWEIKQRTLIDLAAARGAFICQSQSLNLFVADPTYAKLTSMHFYSWKKGLKTGIYYLRTRAPVMAQKFTVDPEIQAEAERAEAERQKRAGEAEEGCLVCSA